MKNLVKVKSLSEIGKTLDEDLCAGGIEFVYDMLPFCGKKFIAHPANDGNKNHFYFVSASGAPLPKEKNFVWTKEWFTFVKKENN